MNGGDNVRSCFVNTKVDGEPGRVDGVPECYEQLPQFMFD